MEVTEIITYDTSSRSRKKVFFVINDGNVSEKYVGNYIPDENLGIQLYVDDYVAEQIEKCELFMDGLTPKLRLKEGETMFIPEDSEEYRRQREIEELKQRLKELKGDEDNEV